MSHVADGTYSMLLHKINEIRNTTELPEILAKQLLALLVLVVKVSLTKQTLILN